MNFKVADLTGGTDTRLNFQALQDLGISFTYACEDQNLEKNLGYAYDFKVMQMFLEKYRFNTEFVFKNTRSPRKYLKNSFGLHRHYEGDVYENCLSGMYGGELFGGAAYSLFFSQERQQASRQQDQELLALFSEVYFKETRPVEEEIAESCRQIIFSDPLTLLSIYMLYGSSLYFRANEAYWLENYLLSARKISPFLGDAVIRALDTEQVGKQLEAYRFYLRLYQTCAPEMLKIPFNSYFAKLFPEDVLDVQKLSPLPAPENSGSPRGELPLMAQKIKLLKEYLQDNENLAYFCEELP